MKAVGTKLSITKDNQYAAIKERIQALYHNCKSAAAFKRQDALLADGDTDKEILRREATAYETLAGWLQELKSQYNKSLNLTVRKMPLTAS